MPHAARPSRPPVRRRPWRGAVVAAGVVCALTAGIPAASAASSPRDRLRSAAHGTLSGGYGTIQFRTDGTARFVVKECGYQPVKPGFVTTFTDCPADTATGKVTVTDQGYQLRRRDGSSIRYSAYADTSNQVHLGFGAVGRLTANRTGTVSIAPSEQLVVATAGCQYVQAGAAHAVPCQFAQDTGRTILLYPAPNAGSQTGSQLAGLVYLPGPRLLVSPDMVDRIFRRT